MSQPAAPAAVPAHPDIEVGAAETAFSGFLRIDVVRFRHRLFSGEWSPERSYDVMRRGDAAAVLLYDPDRDRVVLVEQFRLPPIYSGCSPWQIEAVAGLVEAGEPYDAVARRETREEAGLDIIGALVPIQRYLPSPGSSDEAVMLYCGRVDSRVAGGVYGVPEEGEDIRVVVKSVAEVGAMVDAGQIDTGHTLLCLYWFLRHRDRLRRMWAPAG